VLRLLSFDPQSMYLTHYGPVGTPRSLSVQFLQQLDEMVALGRSMAADADRHQRLKQGLAQMYLRRAREHGCAMSDARILELLAMDIELNAQGMGVWLDRPEQA